MHEGLILFSPRLKFVLTCIYRWNPRFRSVTMFTLIFPFPSPSIMRRRDCSWKIGALFRDVTAERVGARHNDSLDKWSS